MVCISPFLPYIFASNSKKYDMEIISIEDRTFDRMLKRLETAARMAEDVHRRFREKKMGEWLDNQEACILLNITPRTLQSLRENGCWLTARFAIKSITYRKTYRKHYHCY